MQGAVAADRVLVAAGIGVGVGVGVGVVIGVVIAWATWHWPRLAVATDAVVRSQPGVRRWAIIATAAIIGAASLLVAPLAAGVAGAVFGWLLLALLVLDVEHFWLPDRLTGPLVVSGLVAGLFVPPGLTDRAIGAAIGFASLAGIAWGYRAVTGRVGLGGGDPRLFAGIGAWLGWVTLPFVLLLAAILGLVLIGYDRLSGRTVTRYTRVPLGALLAASAWLLWLLGPVLPWGIAR